MEQEDKVFDGDIRLSGVQVSIGSEKGARKLTVSRLETDQLRGHVAGLSYEIDSFSMDAMQTVMGRGQSTADAVDLAGIRARSDDGELVVSARQVSFPRGLQFTRDEEVFAPHASIEDARITIDGIDELLSGMGAGRDKDRAGEREPMDLHFLDVLQGHLHIDLVVDMSLPWIGRKSTTHYFRVPIQNGTIDYEKIEDDVHWLQGAFLTLDLVDDKLVLARDLPVVPLSKKILLQWSLEPQDIPVARYHRVHIRNLLRWQQPAAPAEAAEAAKADRGKPRKLALHALAMENVELSLDADKPVFFEVGEGIVQLGDADQPGLVNARVTGALRYDASRALEPTALRGQVDLIDLTVKDIRLGAMSVSADRLHIGGVNTIALHFRGFRPYRLELEVDRVAATNLRLRLPERA